MVRLTIALLFVGVIMWGIGAPLASAEGNSHGIDPKNFDTTCAPCKDFYQYANGNWLKNNPIPAAYPMWNIDEELRKRNYDMLKEILESAAMDKAAPKGSERQKIGDFYAAAMDTNKIEKDGIAPLKANLDKIAAITTRKDLEKVIADFQNQGLGVVFDITADQDLKNTTMEIVYVYQGGLGMPDRDYYTKSDDEIKKIRDTYVAHVTAMFRLLGDSPEAAKAATSSVMDIETKLAEASLTKVELRDPNAEYNIKSLAEAEKLSPNFSWTAFFKTVGHPEVTSFSYAHPKYVGRMDSLIAQEPLANWKNYLRWHVVHASAPYLGSAFVNEDFNFYSKTLRGSKELKPRWRRALETINFALGEALGKLYVEKAFPPSAKASAMEMVDNLKVALHDRIQNLPWMSEATKEKALKKLASFTVKIGYPDKWRDYSALTVDRSSYAENAQRAAAFELHRQLNRIGRPVDRTEWGMSPQTINAYYNPTMNEIVFPAGILQPPYFDAQIDDAVNYGGMGATIGHEMTHGFDDEGSQFAADGNLENWWTEADRKEFDKRSDVLVKQFDDYVAVDSLHCNGKLTLGENIADLGGLLVAYDALEKSLAGKEKKLIDGFTPEQRFFLSYAQSWRTNMRPEYLRLLVNTNEHAPANFRTLAPLQDMPEFYKAFGCKPGDKMVRDDKDIVRIW
jgi:putative endopeptidase